jgi:hypothetical protein
MKLFCILTAFAATAFATVNPQLREVKRVYILAMSGGMDQYLANQLAKAGIFEVVTDPKKADAIVTDRVGEPFEKMLDDLYPAPVPPKKEPDKESEATDPGASGPKSPGNDRLAGVDFGGGAVHVGSFGRGKGNFFVVNRASRAVVWSVYERSKNSTPGEMTKTAGRVVKHLQEDLTGKKPAE